MGMWKWILGKKGKHDHEAGSSFVSSGSATADSTSPPAFSISLPATPLSMRPYTKTENMHALPGHDHAPAVDRCSSPEQMASQPDRVPVQPVPAGGRTRLLEINRRCTRFPPALVNSSRYTVDSPL